MRSGLLIDALHSWPPIMSTDCEEKLAARATSYNLQGHSVSKINLPIATLLHTHSDTGDVKLDSIPEIVFDGLSTLVSHGRMGFLLISVSVSHPSPHPD